MKSIKFIIIIILLWNGFRVNAQQDDPKPFFKYSLEYFYPNYFYYSKFWVSLPIVNSGLKYCRYYGEKKVGFHSSLFLDFLPRSRRTVTTTYGETVTREVLFASMGINKGIITNAKMYWDGFLELNGRFGDIGWFISKNEFESNVGNQYLVDAGFSLGSSFKYRFNRFFFSAELKQSFYFLLYQNGDELLGIPPAPRHTLTGSVGCGFYFGEQ